MATLVRASTVAEAHARWLAIPDNYLPRKFAKAKALFYGRVAWGLTPKEVRAVLSMINACDRGTVKIGYANAYTSRACSSGVGSVPVSFDYYSREDFDRVAGEGCEP